MDEFVSKETKRRSDKSVRNVDLDDFNTYTDVSIFQAKSVVVKENLSENLQIFICNRKTTLVGCVYIKIFQCRLKESTDIHTIEQEKA